MNAIIHTQDWKHYKSHYIMEHQGLAMLRITEDADELEISDLYVHEQYRGKNLGNQILCIAIDFCKSIRKHGKITIMVNENSDTFVEDWYRKKGFILERMEIPVLGEEDDEWFKVYAMTF